MSEIKSNSDDLVLNSDGGTSTIKFQTNGVERGSISTTGAFTATTIDATALTGALPAISGASLTNLPAGGVAGIVSTANATAITIDANEQVGLGTTTPAKALEISTAASATTELLRLTSTNSTGELLTIGFKNNGLGNPVTKIYGGSSTVGGEGEFKVTITNPSGTEQEVISAVNTAVNKYTTMSVDGSEKLRILSGGGISFNGDTATANALDDYEEGSWTPTVYIGGTNNTQTSLSGTYTKIGRTVYITGNVHINNTISGTGQLLIYGIPFNSGSTDSCKGFSFQCNDGMDMGEAVMYIVPNSNRIGCLKLPDSIGANMGYMDHTHLNATAGGKYISFSVWYFA